MKRTYRYKKGDRPHLDEVYSIMGILPYDAIHQDDPNDRNGDSGESILFLRDVTIKIEIID